MLFCLPVSYVYFLSFSALSQDEQDDAQLRIEDILQMVRMLKANLKAQIILLLNQLRSSNWVIKEKLYIFAAQF